MDTKRQYILLIAFIGLVATWPGTVNAETRDMIFPVQGGGSYSNDFGAARSGGRSHEGNDIIASKHAPLLAAADGVVSFVAYPEPSWGYAVFIRDDDGYQYRYLHINNDTPGTDDGNGGGMNAFTPSIVSGAKVTAGQAIGYVGDSGNAEDTVAHLHFEIKRPDGNIINPYESLQRARVQSTPSSAAQQDNEILPFDEIPVTTSIAYGNLNGAGGDEIIVGAGPGGGPHIRIFSDDGKLRGSFFAYDPNFRGGVDIATGDTDGDGKDEIIVGAGPGGGPHIRIFDQSGQVEDQFFAYEESYRGGVRVAAADLNGNGRASIITVPAQNSVAQVRVFKHTGKKITQFNAYADNFLGGADVTATSKTDTLSGRIITGANAGGGPQVRSFTRAGKFSTQFMALATSFHGGVRVDAADLTQTNAGFEIAVVPASQGTPDIRLYSMRGDVVSYKSEFEPWWVGGYDVALNESSMMVSTQGGRRASVRIVE